MLLLTFWSWVLVTTMILTARFASLLSTAQLPINTIVAMCLLDLMEGIHSASTWEGRLFSFSEARVSYLSIFEESCAEWGADSINLTVGSKYSLRSRSPMF